MAGATTKHAQELTGAWNVVGVVVMLVEIVSELEGEQQPHAKNNSDDPSPPAQAGLMAIRLVLGRFLRKY